MTKCVSETKNLPGAQYPQAGHGAVFQYGSTTAALVTAFLDNSTIPENPELYNLGTAAQ